MESSGRFASLPFGKSSGLSHLGEHSLSGVGRAALSLAGEPQSEPQPPTRTRTNIHTHSYTTHDTTRFGIHGIIHNDSMVLCKHGDFFQLFPLFFPRPLTNKQHKAFVVSYHKVKPETRAPGLMRQAQGTHDEHTTTHTVPAIGIGSVFTYPGKGFVSDQASENWPHRPSPFPVSSDCPSAQGCAAYQRH